MRVGFTGTRKGMTTNQWTIFIYKLLEFDVVEWHDGDCLGADEQANRTVHRLKRNAARLNSPDIQRKVPLFNPVLHGHPCNLLKYRAFCDYDVIHQDTDPPPPLVRNRTIVDSCDVLLAAPHEFEEQFRGSGTWATIRYARRQGKCLIICWPDGTVTEEKEATLV